MRYEAGQREEILALVDHLGKDLVAELAGAGLDTPRTDWQRARLRDLIAEAEKTVQNAYTEISDAHGTGMAEGVKVSTENLVAAMNEAAGVQLLDAVKWSPNLLKALVDGTLINGAPSADWWARQSVDLQNAFNDQMRQGIMRGEGVAPLVARVKPLLETSTRNAEALVRTSAMAVNNAAQLATYKENADVLQSLQWCATLDPRTCLSCGAQDGEQWAPSETEHITPPLHWNCRCVVVPISRLWEELGIDPPPGTRASWEGPVDKNTTWESWLKGLPAADQKEILGPARQKLWDAGKLSVSDLVDQRGNALNLDELGR